MRAAVEDEGDERERDRGDVREPDEPVRDRGAPERQEEPGGHAHHGEREDREAGDLGALVPHPDHAFRVRDREDEEGDGDRDAERQVQQEHRVEEGGVPREGSQVDRVRRDQPERDQQDPVEPPLPGPEHPRRLRGPFRALRGRR